MRGKQIIGSSIPIDSYYLYHSLTEEDSFLMPWVYSSAVIGVISFSSLPSRASSATSNS
jgi:hypothetical protein